MKLTTKQIISLFERKIKGVATNLQATSLDVVFDAESLPNADLKTENGVVNMKVIHVMDAETLSNKLQFVVDGTVTDEFFEVRKGKFSTSPKVQRTAPSFFNKINDFFFE